MKDHQGGQGPNLEGAKHTPEQEILYRENVSGCEDAGGLLKKIHEQGKITGHRHGIEPDLEDEPETREGQNRRRDPFTGPGGS